MSLRARLVAASLALLVLGLAAADVATYTALRRFLYHRVDVQLDAAEQQVMSSFRQRPDLARFSLEQLRTVLPGVFAQVRNDAGAVVGELTSVRPGHGAVDVPDMPEDLSGLSRRGEGRFVTVGSAQPGGADFRLRLSALPGGGVLAVGLPLDDAGDTLKRLLAIEVLVTVVVLGGAAGVGVWLVRLGLRPLDDIEATAVTITEGDMSGRVAVEDERTEVGRVGRALNTMLDALAGAFARQQKSEEAARASEERMRQFVADASHELRTPVAAVRAYAELYRRGADSRPEDLARLLARIEEEAARMGVLVDDLLLLTRLDEGRPLAQAQVDVGAVAADAVEAAQTVDPGRAWSLEVRGSVEVEGDRDRLRQVVDNLLNNVRSHTPAGAACDVHVWVEDGVAVVEVADRGPGLSEEDAAHVFERFYRADAGRSRDSGGSGLGLSIVAAIVHAHGGTVTVRPRIDGGGAIFRVELPVLEGVGTAFAEDAQDAPKFDPVGLPVVEARSEV